MECLTCKTALELGGYHYSLMGSVPLRQIAQMELPPFHASFCSLECVAKAASLIPRDKDEIAIAVRNQTPAPVLKLVPKAKPKRGRKEPTP